MTNRFFFTSTSIRYILPVVSTIVATQHSFCDFESNLGKGPKTTKGTRDPLACGNPICSDKMSMFNLAKEQVNQKTNKKADESLPKASSIPSDSIESQKNPQQCPLDKNELGRYTWSLLHTMAAYYPELPTEEQQNAALQFISSLALLYPCPHCAADFREAIKLNPPR